MKWIKIHHNDCELSSTEACEDCNDSKVELLNGLTIERPSGTPKHLRKPLLFEKRGSVFFIKSLWGQSEFVDFDRVVNFNGSLDDFTEWLSRCICSASSAGEIFPPLRITTCCPAETIVEYWDGTQTSTTLPAPPEGCTIIPSSIELSANGAEQAPGADAFGFDVVDNGDGTVTVTPTNSWGSAGDPCTMIFNYSINCVNELS